MSSEQQWPNQRKRGRDTNFPVTPQSQPPEKQQKLENSGGRGAYELAGAEAENLFPDPKTTLHNALQVHLKRLNKKLEFSVNRAHVPSLRRDVIRTFVKVPYPEAFTAHGEGNSKKEAEKRCCAAACMKLLELDFIDEKGKRLEMRQEILDEQKPKLLDIPMKGQIEIFEAILCLPQASTFTNWPSLERFYTAQKEEMGYLAKEGEETLFQVTFNPQDTKNASAKPSVNRPGHSHQPQSTNVMLSTRLKQCFPSDEDTSLATLPCPYCLQHISVNMAHIKQEASLTPSAPNSSTLTPSLPPPPTNATGGLLPTPSAPQPQPTQPLCIFSGHPYEDLDAAAFGRRNTELQKQQEAVKQKFENAAPKSPQYTAQHLPVANMKNSVLTEVNTQSVVIITGMTGSGKTTQIPQYIFENYIGHGMGANCNIVVTQPRRISAISIAERVAAERGERVGMNIGFQVRLESCIPQKPGRILYCTTGILLMKLRKNPFLQGVSHVIIDEVHERDVNSDFLLILLREIVRSGAGLKVVLMSASLNAAMFVTYFKRVGLSRVPCVNVQGRCYPVTQHYLPEVRRMVAWRGEGGGEEGLPEPNLELVASLVAHISFSQLMGAILVFLPGWDDIMGVQDLLNSKLRTRMEEHCYLILPCHSMLSSEDQQKVFRVPPIGVRKIILATNIAESSITIDDVVYVVNSGTVKIKTFDPARKITCLATQWSSRSSVTQRQGRAGRCQSGHCYHLFTKETLNRMDEYDIPEMQRTPLEELVLQAKVLNPWQPVAEFLAKALNPPLRPAVISAVTTLKELGALNEIEGLTPMGNALAELPIEPRVGRLILLGTVFGTLDPVLTIAASMGYKDPFVTPPSKRQEADQVRTTMAAGSYSDHFLLLRAFDGWKEALAEYQDFAYVRDHFLHRGSLRMIEGLRNQFLSHLESLGFRSSHQYNRFSSSDTMIRSVLTAGLYPNVVKQARMMESGGTKGEGQKRRVRMGFKTIQDGRVFMHPSSVNSEKSFPSSWFIYYEKVKTSKIFIRDSTLVHPLHLLLFAGKTMDTLSETNENAVVGLDRRDWFAFEMPLNLADLLQCAREAVSVVLDSGLTGQMGKLPDEQLQFLEGLNKFLDTYAQISDES